MTFPAYPEYKDSGVEWLGKIPKSWKVHSLKHITKLKTEKASSKTFSIALENIESWSGRFVETSSEFEAEGVKFSENQILFGKLRPYLAKVFLTKCEGEAVGDLYVLEPTEGVNPRYLQYRMLTREFIDVVDGSTYGSKMPRASWDFLGCMKIPTPTKSEQETITNFLDHETAKIDALIAEQEKLIDLLNEKRESVISNAVCRGLEPNVQMIDSGVEWLGMVPTHWVVMKGRRLFEIKKRIAGELGYAVLSITQKGIKQKDIDSNDGQLSMDYSKYQLVEVGDFAMNHMDLLTGYVDISKERGVTSPDYRVFSLRSSSYIPEYFLLLLQNCYHNKIFYPFGQGSSQLGRWRLPTTQFNEFCYPVPPEKEQKKIVDEVNKTLNSFDKLQVESNLLTKSLNERRSALISAAVTGQIDVRNFQPKAP